MLKDREYYLDKAYVELDCVKEFILDYHYGYDHDGIMQDKINTARKNLEDLSIELSYLERYKSRLSVMEYNSKKDIIKEMIFKAETIIEVFEKYGCSIGEHVIYKE